uniref:Exocyst complex component EXO70A1-like n=1 Tax=Rhizophora mucronata TaxID=61149 RepID=A0A2P2IQ72_RHIMU
MNPIPNLSLQDLPPHLLHILLVKVFNSQLAEAFF